MKRIVFYISALTLIVVVAFAAGCGSAANTATNSKPAATAGKTVGSGAAGNNLTATIASADGNLKKGKQEITLTFTDAAGKPVDVGSAALNFRMPAMGSMSEMNNGATLTTSGTPGVYNCKVDIEMLGEWQAQITYEGPAGKGSATITVSAK